jgi:KUP system potassium uptake protein
MTMGTQMMLWFVSLGALGIYNLSVSGNAGLAASAWHVLRTLLLVCLHVRAMRVHAHNRNPAAALDFFARHGGTGWFALGSVVLAITGCEALFADLGHFGAGPVRFSWIVLAWPCLLLNCA